jgi:hypothetical protein
MGIAVPLQPSNRFRLVPPGVTGLQLTALTAEAGNHRPSSVKEPCHTGLLGIARTLLQPPEELIIKWQYLDRIRCVWLGGGRSAAIATDNLATDLGVPVFQGRESVFAGEEGGIAMLEELGCSGMVCDLGQTQLKVSWQGRRLIFRRNLAALPRCDRSVTYSLQEKASQRHLLRRFIAQSLRQVIEDVHAGPPEGVVFALPAELDAWGQPIGSSYIGMHMDTQLVTHALEMAGLPDIPHWLLNDAELAATSALFDERVIACGGKALVFTLGTAVGCALADPLAAALYIAEQVDDKRAHNT